MRTVIPEGLRALIEPRLERLAADELRILEAASVVGPEFAAHAIAGVAGDGSELADVELVEQHCDALARRQQILRAAGESAWPDGRCSARYAFRHALYQEVIYQGLSPSTRRRLHRTIGDALESAYGDRTPEVAGELAVHFTRGGDVDRAIRHRKAAAGEATTRFAYQEARDHLEAALALLGERAETPERLRRELPILETLGFIMLYTEGYGDEGAARVFARLRDVGQRLGIAYARQRGLMGLRLVLLVRGELAAAREIGAEMIALAEELGDPAVIGNSYVLLGMTLFSFGDAAAARQYTERGRSVLGPDVETERDEMALARRIAAYNFGAWACIQLGRVSESRAMIRVARDGGARIDTPFQRAQARTLTAQACAMLRDAAEARPLAEEAERLSAEHGLSFYRLTATIIRGWCDLEEGRIASGRNVIRDAFDDYTSRGWRLHATFVGALLAGACLADDDPDSADDVPERALATASETGEVFCVPELYRLKGECTLARSDARARSADAIAWFERALADAAERGALLQELRAAASLHRVGALLDRVPGLGRSHRRLHVPFGSEHGGTSSRRAHPRRRPREPRDRGPAHGRRPLPAVRREPQHRVPLRPVRRTRGNLRLMARAGAYAPARWPLERLTAAR